MAAIRWTADQEAQLAHLCATTTMSAGEMADVLGKLRGAVIGKAGRMGLVLPNAGKNFVGRTVNKDARPVVRKDVSSAPISFFATCVAGIVGAVQEAIDKDPELLDALRQMAPAPATPDPATPDPAMRDRFGVLTEGRRNRCLFPVEDRDSPAGPDMLCCGADLTPGATGLGKSFCAHHVRRSTEKRKPVPAFVPARGRRVSA